MVFFNCIVILDYITVTAIQEYNVPPEEIIHVSSNIKHLHWGKLDHLSLFVVPEYTFVRKKMQLDT